MPKTYLLQNIFFLIFVHFYFFFVTFQLMKTSFKKLETISALGVENKFAKKYKDAIFEQYK